MNISLTPELEQLVKDKVNSGRYHSVSEVMGEALRLLDERDLGIIDVCLCYNLRFL
ncbi:MAG: type II toxin-antitoxin system ParD family antitoxin [Nostoc sp. ChiSLP01]|nr:type II toxin-antitoxin system ParD family antitoxin [Nostoc sp. CmiSLP01]MDZ8285992.1 type II toxin-antitoxin system ParD family antitoxin [Nostoc sp. ChiSLP01]